MSAPGGGLVHFGGMDTIVLNFYPEAADVDPSARALANAAAAGTLLGLEGGAGFDTAAAQSAYAFGPGEFQLGQVAWNIGAVTTEACRIYVIKNATDRTDPATGVDVIENIIAAGGPIVDYINLPVAVATTGIYDAPQVEGFHDGLTPAETKRKAYGFVAQSAAADAVFSHGDTVMVAIGSAGATGDIAAPVQVTLTFARTSAST